MDRNKVIKTANGWAMLFVNIMLYILMGFAFDSAIANGDGFAVLAGTILLLLGVLVSVGFFIVNPNYSAVLVLFGSYKGTVHKNGFWWANPFLRKIKLSLRVRNQETSKLKVNDKTGNPVEIAAIVVWKVTDPYKSCFEVDIYEQYVSLQTESALRQLTTEYAYDGDDDEQTLRHSRDEINDRLLHELQERLNLAGGRVTEARLSHLAYAPEIASEMLRRQQAIAVVAARTKIVEGAVGMVEHALEELSKKNIVRLDDDRKAAMVSNLMVVLCSESSATPVVNTGTLYQ